ncbi:hypothetical protein MMC34_002162 [Xylographa carneopallida]|nr:hypothetical protein [Xylographa carneopallida]
MAQSNALMTAHIHFVEDRLSLIHIPLKCYATYVQPLLQLLNPVDPTDHHTNGNGTSEDDVHSATPWATQHSFLNISITPIECSVVCSKALAQEYFAPLVPPKPKKPTTEADQITISSEDFVVISVEGEGLDAGQRVLELTSPLAMAGMYVSPTTHQPPTTFTPLTPPPSSIFFITTYFSDYILVPLKSRSAVIRALEARGFAFEKSAEAYVNVAAAAHNHHRHGSSTSSFESPLPTTPPPTTVSELQARTFALLRRRAIVPRVHRDIRLVQCAGRRDSLGTGASASAQDLQLQIGCTRCIVHPPRFLSLTLTEAEPPALLLERASLPHFGRPDVLLGSMDDVLIPITLNLEPLPFEATGIVCGVAGKLVGEGKGAGGFAGGGEGAGESGRGGQVMRAVEMSYLSTARAGTVMVDERDLDRALELLNAGAFGLDVE